ncbi:AAA family ATPase [Pedobacter gandavensis]|uniref:AAA family ATPase n=1 Tax=Pedobacter gandavensis TaxID=2679963 RepID=UPI00292E3BD6|nr:AAA family ATPase [Pedobacter gandavensis]
MQLLYLYIKDHHTLSGQNLNFGGPLRFFYDQKQSSLTVSENPQYIENFFLTDDNSPGDAIIKGFSAIIGQNGTGKTSVLNFIKEKLTDGERSLDRALLLAAKTDEGKIILYRTSDISLLSDNLAAFEITLSILSLEEAVAYQTQKSYRDEEEFPFLKDTSFINFSNVFDGRRDVENTNLKNIATDHLLHAELSYETTMRIQSTEYSDKLETFRYNETERQVDFVNIFEARDIIPFKLPDRLTISSKRQYTSKNYLRNSKEKSALEKIGLMAIADRIVACLEEMEFHRDGLREWTIAFFYVQSLLNFLQEIALHIQGPFYEFKPLDFKKQEFKGFTLKDINGYLISQLRERSIRREELVHLSEMAEAIENLHLYISVHATGEELQMLKEGRSFELKIDNDTFEKFHSFYKKTFTHRPYLSFDWRSISSGEKAFLNIYSRFFSLSDQMVNNQDKRLSKNVVILIDEGDLYLHPEWQRRFVFLLCEFLTKCYASQNGETRFIQVIFTSNSPIPVSDLPNGNVIFLQKLNGKTIAKDSLEDKKQTFGANIHTLLSDGFFLSHGLMGEFAKQKINSIIEMLQGSREQVMKNRATIEKNISLIGEPLIRTKLVQMFTEKLQMNMMDVDQRLEALESEIRQLKAQQNKG